MMTLTKIMEKVICRYFFALGYFSYVVPVNKHTEKRNLKRRGKCAIKIPLAISS